MQDPNVYLAVDAANLLYSTNKHMHVNYEVLLEFARRRGNLIESSIYVPRTSQAERDRRLLLSLKYAGYTRVISRPLRRRPDNAHKSDIDVALVIDVWEAALRQRMDVLILASGDSDFLPLLEQLNQRGITVDVIGPNQCTAWELIVASTHFCHTSDIDGLLTHNTAPRQLMLQEAIRTV